MQQTCGLQDETDGCTGESNGRDERRGQVRWRWKRSEIVKRHGGPRLASLESFPYGNKDVSDQYPLIRVPVVNYLRFCFTRLTR